MNESSSTVLELIFERISSVWQLQKKSKMENLYTIFRMGRTSFSGCNPLHCVVVYDFVEAFAVISFETTYATMAMADSQEEIQKRNDNE